MSDLIKSASPYLYYPDAAEALEWLVRVLGFRELARFVDGENVVHEAEFFAGNTVIMMAGGREPEPGEGKGLLVIVHVQDIAAQHARVRDAGVSAPEPREKPWGPITFAVKDPWGYTWDFWQKGKAFVNGTGGLTEIRSKAKP